MRKHAQSSTGPYTPKALPPPEAAAGDDAAPQRRTRARLYGAAAGGVGATRVAAPAVGAQAAPPLAVSGTNGGGSTGGSGGVSGSHEHAQQRLHGRRRWLEQRDRRTAYRLVASALLWALSCSAHGRRRLGFRAGVDGNRCGRVCAEQLLAQHAGETGGMPLHRRFSRATCSRALERTQSTESTACPISSVSLYASAQIM